MLEHAQWEFDPENEDRIDIPKLTISGNLIDLSKLEEYGDIMKVELGDTVHVYDLDGTEYAERVIEGTWYPFEAHESLISIGHMRRDMFFTLYQLRHAKRHLEAAQTANKSITTRKLSGVVNSDRNPVRSENKQLLLDGDLLYIEDDRGKRRINLGNMDGVFVFEIFDKTGKKRTIYMNEDGDMTITGVFSTGTENEARTVIDKNGIQSYNSKNQKHGLWSNPEYGDFYVYYNGKEILKLINGNPNDNNGNYSLYLGGNHVMLADRTGTKFGDGISGSFITGDDKIVTVEGGIITDISHKID